MTKKQTSKTDPQDMERQIGFFKNLMKTVGLNPDETGGNVIFTGPGDPLYDSSYHFAEGQSAILAAIGSAVSQIWQLRGGKPQDITVNRYRALHSLHRPGFLKQNGYPIILSAPFNSTGMTHQCGDGRFFETTTTTRHLELGMLQLLDAVNTDAGCRDAYMKWNSFELEQAAADANLCGAVHRTRQEWRSHPQGKALTQIPCVVIEKIADGPPEPLPKGLRPLSGVRILDHTHIIAAPMIGNSLAEQGADVLEVSCHKLERVATNWMDTGFGKLNCYLDLDSPKDVDRYCDLVRESDVVVEGYRPGATASRGLGAKRLVELRPNLIYVSESCYGHVGPWALRKGWENIAQAATGMCIDHGSEDWPMHAPPLFATDYGTGYLGALGTLAALVRRAREGGSYHVRVSLCQTGMWLQDLGDIPMEVRKERAVVGRLTENLMFSAKPNPTALDPINNSAVLIESECSLGTMTHLAPVIEYSDTKAYWERPLVYLGAHKAEWPARP